MFEPSRMNRQTARSRRMLQEAFLALLNEKPYQKISISEIADRADLARSTFYAHFNTKRDLLVSYVDDIFQPFLQAILARGAVPSATNPEEIALEESVCKLWQSNAKALCAIMQAGQELIILEQLREVHQTIYTHVVMKNCLQMEGLFGEFLTSYVAHTYFGILMKWLEHDFQPSAETIARMLHTLTSSPDIREIMDAINPHFSVPS